VICIGETIDEARNNLKNGGAKRWAEKMETVYRVLDHRWAKPDGLVHPMVEDLEDEIIRLSDKLNDDCKSIACGGIVLDVVVEDDINFVEIEILYSPPIYNDELEELEDDIL
jgi:hypothetical protein